MTIYKIAKLADHCGGPEKTPSSITGHFRFLSLLLFVSALSACSTDSPSDQVSESPAVLSPPGIERLSRAIDINTIDARFTLEVDDQTSFIIASPVSTPDGDWVASFTVPEGSGFSVEVVWSAIGDENIRLNYARYTGDYGPVTAVSSFSIPVNEYDVSADTFDHDDDGLSNFLELVGEEPVTPTGNEPLPEPVIAAVDVDAIKVFRVSWTDVAGATFYRVLENSDGESGFVQLGGDISPGVQTYEHRVPLYDRLNAQYKVESCNSAGCSESQLITTPKSEISAAVGYFKASNSDPGDRFGSALAISENGGTLAIRAGGEASSATGVNGNEADNGTADAGAVYVYKRNGNVWQKQAYIKPGNTDREDFFGRSLSISHNGDVLAIGTSREDGAGTLTNGNPTDNSAEDAGAVYIFSRVNNRWDQQAYLKASNTEAGDGFGQSVSLSGDGLTLAVGAPKEDGGFAGVTASPASNGAMDSGAVYIYTRAGNSWSYRSYIKANNAEAGDDFGTSVSLNTTGDWLAVGAQFEDSTATGINGNQNNNNAIDSGAVYVFQGGGASWSAQAYIKAHNTGEDDTFGRSISLNGDGTTLAVGAVEEDSNATGVNGSTGQDNNATASGAAYVFVRNGNSWSRQAFIKSAQSEARDFFGLGVSLSEDGNKLAVGAFGEDGGTTALGGDPSDNSIDTSGAAFVFTRQGGAWRETAYVKATNPDGGDSFGNLSISLSADGNTLAVGAAKESSTANGINGDQNNNSAELSGAVYLY